MSSRKRTPSESDCVDVDGGRYGRQAKPQPAARASYFGDMSLCCAGTPCAPWGVAFVQNRRNGSDIFKVQVWPSSGPRGRVFVTGLMGPEMASSHLVALASVQLNWERLVATLMPTASHQKKLEATRSIFETPLHLHHTAGGEGPSAGVAAFLSLVGFATGLEFRDDTVVTGQVSAGGRVSGVGGCVEKGRVVLAAKGRQRLVVPSENAGELDALQASKGLHVFAVKDVWEALPLVLVTPPLALAAPEQQGQEAGTAGGAPEEMVATLPLVPRTYFRAKVEVLYFQEGHLVPIEIFAVTSPTDGGPGSSMQGGLFSGPGVGHWLMGVLGFARRWVLENTEELVREVGLPDFKMDLERLCVAAAHEGQQGEEGAGGQALTVWVNAPSSAKVNVDYDSVMGAMLVALLALATGLQLPSGEHKTALGPGYLNAMERKVWGHDLHEDKLPLHVAKPTALSAFQTEHVRRLLLPAPPQKLANGKDNEEEEGEEEDKEEEEDV